MAISLTLLLPQVTAVVKYWLGGPDPLDYINMFSNNGCQDGDQHWHYVSCGLSGKYKEINRVV